VSGFTVTPGLEHLAAQYAKEMELDGERLAALAQGSATELAAHAHAMGGKCAMIGDKGLATVLYGLEQDALAGRAARVTAALAEVETLLSHRRPEHLIDAVGTA